MWSHSQTQGGFSAQATLFPKGECDHALLHTLPSSHGRRARWVPSIRSRHFAGRYSDYGTLSFGVSGFPHTERD